MSRSSGIITSCFLLMILMSSSSVKAAPESTPHSFGFSYKLSADSFPPGKREEFRRHSYTWLQWGEDAVRYGSARALVMAGYAGAVSGTIFFAERLLGPEASLAVRLGTFALSDALAANNWQDYLWRSTVNIAGTAVAPRDSPLVMASRFLLSQLWLLKETGPDIWLGLQPEYEGVVPIRFMNPFMDQFFKIFYSIPDDEHRWQQGVPGLDILFEDNSVVSYLAVSPMERQLIQLHATGIQAGIEKIQLLPDGAGSSGLEVDLMFSNGSHKRITLPVVLAGDRKACWWTTSLAEKRLRKLALRQTLVSPVNQCVIQQLISAIKNDDIKTCRLSISGQHLSGWQNLAVISAGSNSYWLFDYYSSQGYELPEIWLNTGQESGTKYPGQVNELEWMREPAPARGLSRLARESILSFVYQGVSTLFVCYLDYLRQAARQDLPSGHSKAPIHGYLSPHRGT